MQIAHTRRRSVQVHPQTQGTSASAANASESTAEAVVCAALELLPKGCSRQDPRPLVALLKEQGIVRGWQLARMTTNELRELAVDGAGWSIGDMLALREAVDRESFFSSATDAIPPMLQSTLHVPKSASKADLRAFAGVRVGFRAIFAGMHVVPPDEAKASFLQCAEYIGNMAIILAFVLWQMRVGYEKADASYGDIAAVHNFVISLAVLFCIFAFMSSMMFLCFNTCIPAERFRCDPAFSDECARYLQWTITISFPGQFCAIAALLTEAWHGQKQWYAVALTALLFLLWGVQGPKDIRLCARAHALSVLHCPRYFHAMLGLSIKENMVDEAKRQSDQLRSMFKARLD